MTDIHLLWTLRSRSLRDRRYIGVRRRGRKEADVVRPGILPGQRRPDYQRGGVRRKSSSTGTTPRGWQVQRRANTVNRDHDRRIVSSTASPHPTRERGTIMIRRIVAGTF